ncbi:hypothetical protein LA635_0114 [Erwinia amylovora LA635]|nr:hypothetical protein LA635_0114 [Erwinia amylovora LA635]CDK17106.1 hypothetical protein LA636_0113 [Erwinia amylovora LA636]CDK20475.1 hypothetical protein LA637_0114 [Erwinia amylovora LA637]
MTDANAVVAESGSGLMRVEGKGDPLRGRLCRSYFPMTERLAMVGSSLAAGSIGV